MASVSNTAPIYSPLIQPLHNLLTRIKTLTDLIDMIAYILKWDNPYASALVLAGWIGICYSPWLWLVYLGPWAALATLLILNWIKYRVRKKQRTGNQFTIKDWKGIFKKNLLFVYIILYFEMKVKKKRRCVL